MIRAHVKTWLTIAAFFLFGSFLRIHSQDSLSSLTNSGQATVDGHSAPYLIRHLPVSSFLRFPQPFKRNSIAAAVSSRKPTRRTSRKTSSTPALSAPPPLTGLSSVRSTAQFRSSSSLATATPAPPLSPPHRKLRACSSTVSTKFSASTGPSTPRCPTPPSGAARHEAPHPPAPTTPPSPTPSSSRKPSTASTSAMSDDPGHARLGRSGSRPANFVYRR